MKRLRSSMTWPHSNASWIARSWLVALLACGAIVNCFRSLIPRSVLNLVRAGRDSSPHAHCRGRRGPQAETRRASIVGILTSHGLKNTLALVGVFPSPPKVEGIWEVLQTFLELN